MQTFIRLPEGITACRASYLKIFDTESTIVVTKHLLFHDYLGSKHIFRKNLISLDKFMTYFIEFLLRSCSRFC